MNETIRLKTLLRFHDQPVRGSPFFLSLSLPAVAQEDLKPQILVDQALVTLDNFVKKTDMEWLKSHLADSKGVIIVPQLLKAGVYLWRFWWAGVWCWSGTPKRENGASPVFYSLGSVSFGLQIGGESSEVIIQIRTQRGLESLYGTSFKLGGDTSVALGPRGARGAAGKGVDSRPGELFPSPRGLMPDFPWMGRWSRSMMILTGLITVKPSGRWIFL